VRCPARERMVIQLVYEGKPKVKGKMFEGGGRWEQNTKKANNIYK
jgi:hypothetical protein